MTPEQAAVDVPTHVVEYLSSQNTLTLATASPSGVPHASTFLYVNDGPTLYFWTRPGTTTARHLEQNPVVSFAIDEYAEDLRQTRGVQGSGECAVVLNGETIARVADLFGQKFPDLSPGATMSISFFRIVPTELQFIDNTGTGGKSQEGQFGADFSRERAYSVFADLPVQRVDSVAEELQPVKVQADEIVVRQGAPPTSSSSWSTARSTWRSRTMPACARSRRSGADTSSARSRSCAARRGPPPCAPRSPRPCSRWTATCFATSWRSRWA